MALFGRSLEESGRPRVGQLRSQGSNSHLGQHLCFVFFYRAADNCRHIRRALLVALFTTMQGAKNTAGLPNLEVVGK